MKQSAALSPFAEQQACEKTANINVSDEEWAKFKCLRYSHPELLIFYRMLSALASRDELSRLPEFECFVTLFKQFIAIFSADFETVYTALLNKQYLHAKANMAALKIFAVYMLDLQKSYGKPGFDRLQRLQQGLDDLALETKPLKQPMHPALAILIGGLIGALVCGALLSCAGLTVVLLGAPALLLGLVHGFIVGSALSVTIGVAVGSLFSVTGALCLTKQNNYDRKEVDMDNRNKVLADGVKACVEEIKAIASVRNLVRLV